MKNGEARCGACRAKCAQKYKFCPVCGASLAAIEGEYHLTLVKEKNVRQRNLLLLGAVLFLTATASVATVYSIFNKSFDVAAVETDDLFAFVADVDPLSLTPAEEIERNKKKRGGGGGGRNDANPAQKGAEATQTENPLFSPSKDYVRMTDPELKIRAATEGKKQNPVTDEPYGLKNGGLIPSDGRGCCGGQGDDGRGKGQGDDEGDGLGPGKNGGSGGPGTGVEGGNTDPKDVPEVKIARVSVPVNIISKPRANYTNEARENVVQGKVVLRVTFLASGGIGAIAVVSGLPYGLTEQAIAAARAIRFEPAKANGVAVNVTKTIEYNFTIF